MDAIRVFCGYRLIGSIKRKHTRIGPLAVGNTNKDMKSEKDLTDLFRSQACWLPTARGVTLVTCITDELVDRGRYSCGLVIPSYR